MTSYEFSTSTLADHFMPLLVILVLSSCLFFPSVSYADGLDLQSVSMRTRVSEKTVLGEDAPEDFEELDVSANHALPWLRNSLSGWHSGTRLMSSTGILRGADKNALVVSFIPELYLESEDSDLLFDIGVGGALFSRYRFGDQDFGGPFQFALTLGISVPIYKKLGAGYRFLHYSDAGVNGAGTTGADFHMIEFIYRQ